MQRVRFAGNQLSRQNVCCAVCCPFLDHVFVLVQQLHHCTLDVVSVRIHLAERYTCGLVVHFNVRDRAVCIDCECHIFGDRPAVRSRDFTKCIGFAGGQDSLDQMCFAGGYPFLNDVAVLVDDL